MLAQGELIGKICYFLC